MENSIVRGAIQGLIDDSKIIDKLCDKLDCKRTEILDKIDSRGEDIATIEQIKEVIHAVQKTRTYVSDARYSAEESKDQAYNAVSECDDADAFINDAHHITDQWETKIKELEEVKVEADTEVVKKAPAKKLTEEQKEINNSNQYAVINN
jgi:hypothetical protein